MAPSPCHDQGEPVPCEDGTRWALWYGGSAARRVVRQQSFLSPKTGHVVYISTVFLGIDHAFMGGPSILWETMVFQGDDTREQRRYRSKAEAIEGHNQLVRAYGGTPLGESQPGVVRAPRGWLR